MNKSLNIYSRRNQLQPLCELNRDDLDYLFDRSTVVALEPRTLITIEKDTIWYLLEGEVTILSGGFVVEKFNHSDKRALKPMFDENSEEDSGVITSHGAVLNIDRRLFDGLYSQHLASYQNRKVCRLLTTAGFFAFWGIIKAAHPNCLPQPPNSRTFNPR